MKRDRKYKTHFDDNRIKISIKIELTPNDQAFQELYNSEPFFLLLYWGMNKRLFWLKKAYIFVFQNINC